jgi:hypothetical protein
MDECAGWTNVRAAGIVLVTGLIVYDRSHA